ncbi:MAG TPA: ATP-binding protein [Cytophagaceae bacterium]|jgi:two-component system phosphate regulon sensor histidine kinase PhoR|nr:ATP-binding protein [Cytophagaceae bacterium]
MLFNAKTVSLIVSIVLAVFMAAILYTILDFSILYFFYLFVFFIVTLAIVFFSLEIFVFHEIDTIYKLLEKIKKKDYSFSKPKINIANRTPLRRIKEEIIDFAEKKQMEIEELKKLETFRREFLADVSHELKTPIFAAQGFVHTLIDGAVDDIEVRDKFLTKAANSLDGLNMLVQDLITISQLEIGEIKMHVQSFDLLKLTEDIFDQLEESAAKRGTKLKFYKYNPKSCYVFADKMRIGQVMTNLIVNAVKYGKDGGTVLVKFVIENEEVDVSVKDDGPGIEQKHLTRIFERFYRVEKSRAKDRGGTGLGLGIVKHIVEAHNSKVRVESVMGEGTNFMFKLKRGKVINNENTSSMR